MPDIPGVTALHGDSEPGLDLVGLHTQPPLLFAEAYRITKLEKPWQNMAYRLHGPEGPVLQLLMGVNRRPSDLLCLPPTLLRGSPYVFFEMGGTTGSMSLKRSFTLNSSHPNSGQPGCYVIPRWQDQQPWQLPTWPKRLTDPCQGLHNKWQTGQCLRAYSNTVEVWLLNIKAKTRSDRTIMSLLQSLDHRKGTEWLCRTALTPRSGAFRRLLRTHMFPHGIILFTFSSSRPSNGLAAVQ